MPPGAGDSRGRSIAELSMILQNLISNPEVGDWIQDASHGPNLTPWQSANLDEMKRLFVQNTAVSPEINRRLVIAQMRCEQQWRRLRAANDWKAFQPSLKEVLELTRQMLTELSHHTELPLYDSALMLYSRGLSTEVVEKLFGELKSFLPQMTEEVVRRQSQEDVLKPEGHFPMAAQKALALELMGKLGFDSNIGRLDESHHPFCGGTPRDVRITTRYNETEFLSSLMGVLHETGHALYEQNLPRDWVEQPVGAACGMSIHESQSLLMEMQVVRSAEFLEFAAPLIRKHFGRLVQNPKSLETENLRKLVGRVQPGFIRTEADEVTYPAHVILRFEIERDLIEDRWPLSELPQVWDEKMRSYLGLSTLQNDANGCMQDVHWPGGMWGYFPAYTFGAVIAAQLFATINKSLPQVRQQIRQGDFSGIQGWLKQNIWSQGSRVDTLALVNEVSGPLSVDSFKKHLETRYLS